jgi:AAA+ superfamily predicted ATPase
MEISKTVPLNGWGLDLALRWNSNSYSVFVLHGNIFDIYPTPDEKLGYQSLKGHLAQRFFPDRQCVMFYDVSDGLTFLTDEMKAEFLEWWSMGEKIGRGYGASIPNIFIALAPILKEYFYYLNMKTPDKKKVTNKGATLILEFPEKIFPSAEDSNSNIEERMSVVALLKWAVSAELRRLDVGVFLLAETMSKLQADIIRNPNIAQIRVEMPEVVIRKQFIESPWVKKMVGGKEIEEWCELSANDFATRCAGLNLIRIKQVINEAVYNDKKVTIGHIASSKKKLIEEYCQGLVSFMEPDVKYNLDCVANHVAAKKKLRDLAWLIKNGKTDVLERGVLLPGRIGVGKSFIVKCFASECGLPVMVIGEFRSKWVGDTESQLARILITIRALGPVIVVVDEAATVFGNQGGDNDSGVSSRVFSAFANHIGDASLRGRELWIAMTSRPDLMAIDMKRQGRFGLCIPLFPSQNEEEVVVLFTTVAAVQKLKLDDKIIAFVKEKFGDHELTGSDVESILVRSKERAVLEKRDNDVTIEDIQIAIDSFIDPLDPKTLRMQELAALLACSDRRYLSEKHQKELDGNKQDLVNEFSLLKRLLGNS